MKITRFIVFSPLLFTFFSCSEEIKDHSNDNSGNTIILHGSQQRDTVFLDFRIPQKTITAQRTGKLERVVETPEFKKNSLLVQFDNYDAFVELSGEKEALKEDLINQLNNLPKSLRPMEKKWRDFANKLSPDKMMPVFPTIEYKEEAGFIEEAKLEEKYLVIQKKELAVQNYFQISPEDGFITQVHAHTDESVRKGKPLITYHPKKVTVLARAAFSLTGPVQKQITSDLMVRLPVTSIHASQLTESQVSYSLVLNQKLEAKYCPKYVIIHQDQLVFYVPKAFIGTNNEVLIEGKKTPLKASYRNGKYIVYSKQKSLKITKP